MPRAVIGANFQQQLVVMFSSFLMLLLVLRFYGSVLQFAVAMTIRVLIVVVLVALVLVLLRAAVVVFSVV